MDVLRRRHLVEEGLHDCWMKCVRIAIPWGSNKYLWCACAAVSASAAAYRAAAVASGDMYPPAAAVTARRLSALQMCVTFPVLI